MRKAYNSLNHLWRSNLLFVFLNPPDGVLDTQRIKATTNSLEGGINSQLKLLARTHRGRRGKDAAEVRRIPMATRNRPSCDMCGHLPVKNGKTAAGTQRWLCSQCNVSSINTRATFAIEKSPAPPKRNEGKWCGLRGSNPRPTGCKPVALPAELKPQCA